MYEESKLYLKTKLPKASLDFRWSNENNSEFFTYIKEVFPKKKVFHNEDQEDIEIAFEEYFEDVGYIVFDLKENNINLDVLPYEVEPKDSVNIDEIIDIIHDNEDFVEFNYKGNENQILIQKELRDMIFDFVYCIENEKVNRKELVKYVLSLTFELDEHDIILIKESSIFIKLLAHIKKKVVKEEEKCTIANRFNGIEEEELINFYTEFFSTDNKIFCSATAKEFVNKYFIEEKIDNAEYEKNVFSYIQEIIIKQLNKAFDKNDEFFKGFAGYVFRIHFQEVFYHISDLILHELYISNTYMSDFLKYYSLNIIVVNGIKYQIPAIEADNGLKWNVISITSIAKVYIKVKLSIEKLYENLSHLEKEASVLCKGKVKPTEYNDKLLKQKNKLVEEISYETKELSISSDRHDITKDKDEKENLKKKLREIKKKIADLKHEKGTLSSKVLDSDVIKKYTQFEVEIQRCKRQIKAEQKILEQNTESFISVKKSIIKVLISKKKRI